ncbi:hypothetical protein LINPERHAP1_LOCUS13626, partial [Linum perenne]
VHTITQSDHAPLTIILDPTIRTSRRGFKYEESWLFDSSYLHQVQHNWCKGSSSTESLKFCAIALTDWKKKVIGNNSNIISQLLHELDVLSSLQTTPLNAQRIININGELAKRWSMQEAYWSQRAKSDWLQLGDNNTKFFHRSTQQRRSLNSITSLLTDDDTLLNTPPDLSAHIVQFYTNLFTQPLEILKSRQQSFKWVPLRPLALMAFQGGFFRYTGT